MCKFDNRSDELEEQYLERMQKREEENDVLNEETGALNKEMKTIRQSTLEGNRDAVDEGGELHDQ